LREQLKSLQLKSLTTYCNKTPDCGYESIRHDNSNNSYSSPAQGIKKKKNRFDLLRVGKLRFICSICHGKNASIVIQTPRV